MKHRILLFTFFLFYFVQSEAQTKSNKGYAIVSSDISKAGWMNIQEIDLSTGQVVRTVFEKGKTSFTLIDGLTKKELEKPAILSEKKAILAKHNTASLASALNATAQAKISAPQGNNQPNSPNSTQGISPTQASSESRKKAMTYSYYTSPTASMVAAAALDATHNKLFFTPIGFGELRWINLNQADKSLKVYCLTGQAFSTSDSPDEGYNFTRMVIAADGNGYVLSNDANSFIRFTTGNKPVITKLGAIQENAKDGTESIHNRVNWGGDMVADAMDNLYVIAANHAVFKININTKSSSYLGMIEGLPQNYTTNGSAIDNTGSLIVSSANSAQGYYKVDLASLKAEKQPAYVQAFSCSDLASSNFAFNRTADVVNPASKLGEIIATKQSISVFPNPVRQSNLNVSFHNMDAGQYVLQLVDMEGKTISQKRVTVNTSAQTEKLSMNSQLAKGSYFVKILNGSKKIVQTEKIISQ